MNLIGAAERASYKQAFVDLHDTFSQPIVVWLTAEQVVVSTNPNYNGFYNNAAQQKNVQLVPQSGVFQARIKYLTAQEILAELGTLTVDQQVKISISLGGVRIRVSGDAVPFLNKSDNITFNGETHKLIQRDRPHGLFDNDFYDYILQRIP